MPACFVTSTSSTWRCVLAVGHIVLFCYCRLLSRTLRSSHLVCHLLQVRQAVYSPATQLRRCQGTWPCALSVHGHALPACGSRVLLHLYFVSSMSLNLWKYGACIQCWYACVTAGVGPTGGCSLIEIRLPQPLPWMSVILPVIQQPLVAWRSMVV